MEADDSEGRVRAPVRCTAPVVSYGVTAVVFDGSTGPAVDRASGVGVRGDDARRPTRTIAVGPAEPAVESSPVGRGHDRGCAVPARWLSLRDGDREFDRVRGERSRYCVTKFKDESL